MHTAKKSVQIISTGGEVMGRKKRGKKKKIKIGIEKKVPKIKLKKKKNLTISKEKSKQKPTKGNGLFQSFFKSFSNFKKKQKVESFQQMKFGGKEKERQIEIKEEQRKLKEDEKKLQEEEE